MNSTELRQSWEALRSEQPKIRIRQAAEALGVSEGDLLQLQDNVIRLKRDWAALFTAFGSLGKVMALTRNESAVHERKGIYHNVSFNPHVGLVVNPDIDLRIFPSKFAEVFAVPVENARGTLYSIQFFDTFGEALHKVYVMEEEFVSAYNELVDQFRDEDQSAVTFAKGAHAPSFETSDDVDEASLLSDWAALKDTHDFFPLLKKHKTERTHALRIAEGHFTRKVPNQATAYMLEMASQREVPIMVFVGNPGIIQIHSGPVQKIKKMNEWLNVMDPDFNLHLREDQIHDSWIVEKPTEDGIVTSLEIFDRDKNNIATFFGARKPGIPELDSWRDLISDLTSEYQVTT